MVHSFEELSQDTPSQPKPDSEVISLLHPLAVAGALLYISITVFGPFILLEAPLVGGLPLFFGILFFVVTAVYVLGWAGWTLLHKKVQGTVTIKHGWPLLAIPVAIGFFYLFGAVLRLFI